LAKIAARFSSDFVMGIAIPFRVKRWRAYVAAVSGYTGFPLP